MKTKFKIILAFILTVSLFGCEEESEIANKQENIPTAYAFNTEQATLKVSQEQSNFTLIVEGTKVSTSDKTFDVILSQNVDPYNLNYNQSPNDYSVPSSVTIPAGNLTGSVDIPFDFNNLSYGEIKHLVLDLIVPADLIKNTSRQTIDIEYLKFCSTNSMNLSILFDGYSEEISWQILDSSGTVLYSNSYTSGLSTINEPICLSDGTYTFVINDIYGDGLSFPSNGDFSLSLNGVDYVTGGGNFGFSFSSTFTLP